MAQRKFGWRKTGSYIHAMLYFGIVSRLMAYGVEYVTRWLSGGYKPDLVGIMFPAMLAGLLYAYFIDPQPRFLTVGQRARVGLKAGVLAGCAAFVVEFPIALQWPADLSTRAFVEPIAVIYGLGWAVASVIVAIVAALGFWYDRNLGVPPQSATR
jgi:hypothetical protein